VDKRMTGDTSPIRAVVVGPGAIGRIHALAMEELDDFQVVGLAGGAGPAGRLRDELLARGAPPPMLFDDLADALDHSGSELFVIATPSALHAEQAVAALEHGKHVLIEKPLDVDLAAARRLVRGASEAAQRGQLCSVMSQQRFNEANTTVKEAVSAGRFGSITLGVVSVPWWRSPNYYSARPWRGSWALDGGGALMNQGAHAVDLLLWILGTPSEVLAKTSRSGVVGSEAEGTAVASLLFDSGALASLSVTVSAYPGNVSRFQVCGTKGSAVIEGDRLLYFYAKDSERAAAPDMGLNGAGNQVGRPRGDVTVVDATIATSGHKRQYRALATALRTGAPAPIGPEAGLLTLATTLAVYASSKLGRAVQIDDVIGGRYDDLLMEMRRGGEPISEGRGTPPLDGGEEGKPLCFVQP
jgi:UDP-N-acetyl-2-amino-2-deoxyglucuronate dehydrogenase